MSDRGISTLTVVASTKEAQEQLKIFTQKSKSADMPFSLQPLFPPPEEMNESAEWFYTNWGIKWDVYNSKILCDRQDMFIVEFGIIDGNLDKWLDKVSINFPDLYFYNKYYFGPWEGECLLEGKNGCFINHCYCPSNPTELNSDDLNDYEEFALIAPKDANGQSHPFTLNIINSTTVLVLVKDVISFTSTNKMMLNDFLKEVVINGILRTYRKMNSDIPVNLNRNTDNLPVLEYSFLVNCKTVREAIDKTIQRIDKINEPFNEFIIK